MDKESIYAAVLSKLAKRELDALSLTDIADMLSVKKPSLYFYFKNKDDLIESSIKYAENCINISNFNLDLSLEIEDLFFKIFNHYYEVFSSKIPRNYLSIITRIADYDLPQFMSSSDIIYTFETQISVILFSLIDNKKLSLNTEKVDSLSHIIALLIFETIVEADSKEKAQWYISRNMQIINNMLSVYVI